MTGIDPRGGGGMRPIPGGGGGGIGRKKTFSDDVNLRLSRGIDRERKNQTLTKIFPRNL
jgi:hypothetical protein